MFEQIKFNHLLEKTNQLNEVMRSGLPSEPEKAKEYSCDDALPIVDLTDQEINDYVDYFLSGNRASAAFGGNRDVFVREKRIRTARNKFVIWVNSIFEADGLGIISPKDEPAPAGATLIAQRPQYYTLEWASEKPLGPGEGDLQNTFHMDWPTPGDEMSLKDIINAKLYLIRMPYPDEDDLALSATDTTEVIGPLMIDDKRPYTPMSFAIGASLKHNWAVQLRNYGYLAQELKRTPDLTRIKPVPKERGCIAQILANTVNSEYKNKGADFQGVKMSACISKQSWDKLIYELEKAFYGIDVLPELLETFNELQSDRLQFINAKQDERIQWEREQESDDIDWELASTGEEEDIETDWSEMDEGFKNFMNKNS